MEGAEREDLLRWVFESGMERFVISRYSIDEFNP